MFETVWEAAAANGIWALLFCLLLVFELKDSRGRESKYQNTIEKLGDGLRDMKEIDRHVGQIFDELHFGVEHGDGEGEDENETKT